MKRNRKDKGGHQLRAKPQERVEEGSLGNLGSSLNQAELGESPTKDGEFCVLFHQNKKPQSASVQVYSKEPR